MKFVTTFDLLQILTPHFSSQCAFEVEKKQSEVSESSQSEMEMSDGASEAPQKRWDYRMGIVDNLLCVCVSGFRFDRVEFVDFL